MSIAEAWENDPDELLAAQAGPDGTIPSEVWSTEEQISTEEVLRRYHQLKAANTQRLINMGVPGIAPPTLQ